MIDKVSAILVAGGQGTRLGSSVPKAFIDLGGRPLLAWSLAVLANHPKVSETIVVVPAELMDLAAVVVKHYVPGKKVSVAAGGTERWASVQNGVKACADAEWVLVHDAARPFVTDTVVDAVLEKAEKYLAVITATTVDDTIRQFEDDRAAGTIDRSRLVRVGTPQLFHKATLLRGFDELKSLSTKITDEAMLMEAIGIDVGIAAGDPKNFKVTTPSDLVMAEAMVKARSPEFPMNKPRCSWAGNDPLYLDYHDKEWGVPVHDDRVLFEFLILEGFQAGLSWITILRKRENFKRAFAGFDWKKVARFTQHDIARLLADTGIIRNRLKITSAITNARCFQKVIDEFGSFDRYVWHFTNHKTIRLSPRARDIKSLPCRSTVSDTMSKELAKRGFKFVGTVICYSFMQAVGMVDDHVKGCWRTTPKHR